MLYNFCTCLINYAHLEFNLIKIKVNKVSSLSLDVKRRQQLYEKALQQALNQAKPWTELPEEIVLQWSAEQGQRVYP